jgi:hypothetical protein
VSICLLNLLKSHCGLSWLPILVHRIRDRSIPRRCAHSWKVTHDRKLVDWNNCWMRNRLNSLRDVPPFGPLLPYLTFVSPFWPSGNWQVQSHTAGSMHLPDIGKLIFLTWMDWKTELSSLVSFRMFFCQEWHNRDLWRPCG